MFLLRDDFLLLPCNKKTKIGTEKLSIVLGLGAYCSSPLVPDRKEFAKFRWIGARMSLRYTYTVDFVTLEYNRLSWARMDMLDGGFLASNFKIL